MTKKFSLVELLITLSIILVLSAMLMPMLNRARETAKSTSCKGNMKQSLTALVIYLDTYEVVSTQRWTDTLIATGLVSYPQISALRCPSWIRERDTHKNVFGMRRIIGDAHTLQKNHWRRPHSAYNRFSIRLCTAGGFSEFRYSSTVYQFLRQLGAP